MIETFEYRVLEKNAHLLFRPDEGIRLGAGLARKIELPPSDPRVAKMAALQDRLLAKNDILYAQCLIHRRYSPQELAAAELLRVLPTCFFEPVGEECGTVYDESTACKFCGAGRSQVSDLELNTTKIPKRADIAVSIASEWVFCRGLADLIKQADMGGVELRPVRHHGKGVSAISPDWVQPLIVAPAVKVIPPTRFGIDPLRDDLEGEYRCPLGHRPGLNILTEVHVDRSTWRGEDMVQTEQVVGNRRGVLVPSPMILVSQRFYQLLSTAKMCGFKVEVAHLI